MDKKFLISGTAINSSAQGLLKLPKRKFYNADYFNDDNQYRHEIANHYKDFKLRRRIRQRKKRVNLYYCGKVEATKHFSLDYQQELPMAVQVFPSFEKIYSPRGHQKFCEQRTPILTYNDSIKRIQISKENTELLKKLAKQQVERLKYQNQCKKWSNDIKTKKTQATNKSNISELQQNKRRSLGKLESIDYYLKRQQQKFHLKSDCGVKLPFSTKSQHRKGDDTLKNYLQLATDFYQQGYLQNIKYLENIGERNQLRRKRQIQQQQQQKIKFHTFTVLSNKTTSNLEFEHTTKNASQNSSDLKQKQINQDNPILWHKNKLKVNEFPSLDGSRNRNCNIRVNIKPQTFNNTSHQENYLSFNRNIYGKKKIIKESKDLTSMNDYLNGNNLEYTQKLKQEHQQPQQLHSQYHNTSFVKDNYPEKISLLNTLIDNLKELDIQEHGTNLPRITLTDYTCKNPNEQEENIQINTQHANKELLNSFLIKTASLDCSQLVVPEQTNYHSEARPPPT